VGVAPVQAAGPSRSLGDHPTYAHTHAAQIFLHAFGKSRPRRDWQYSLEQRQDPEQQRFATPLPLPQSRTPAVPPYVVPRGWAGLLQ
jgi:hypothetical protein